LTKASRPRIVLVLMILQALSAIGGLAGGAGLLMDPMGQSFLQGVGGGVLTGYELPFLGSMIALPIQISILVGCVLLSYGVIGSIVVWGLFAKRRWAWKVLLVLATVQVAWSVAQIHWIGLSVMQESWIVLQVMILFLLHRPPVKGYFRIE